MKQKQRHPERVERRRPLVEMNLISERTRARAAARRAGCAQTLTLVVAVAGALVAAGTGLALR